MKTVSILWGKGLQPMKTVSILWGKGLQPMKTVSILWGKGLQPMKTVSILWGACSRWVRTWGLGKLCNVNVGKLKFLHCTLVQYTVASFLFGCLIGNLTCIRNRLRLWVCERAGIAWLWCCFSV